MLWASITIGISCLKEHLKEFSLWCEHLGANTGNLRGRKNLSHTDIGIVPYVTCTTCDMENNNFRPEEAQYLKTVSKKAHQ